MQDYRTRSNRLSTIASLVSIFMAICAYFAGIYSGLSGSSPFFIAFFVAILTFVPARYLIDKYYPAGSIEAISGDTAQGPGLIEENEGGVLVPESSAEESPSMVDKPNMDMNYPGVVAIIKKEFNPQIVRDDAELESRLLALLSGKYKGHVRRDSAGADGKIHIVLDDGYGIGTKVVRDEAALEGLIREVDSDVDRYEQLAVVLFLDRMFAPRIDLEKYTEKLDQYGVAVVVKQGMIEGRY